MSKKDGPKKNPYIRLVNFGENEWEFEYTRLTQKEWDRFYDLIDLWNSGTRGNITKTEKGYRQLLSEFPEFIDVSHHLAMLLDETTRGDEAIQIWGKAVNIGLSCFPTRFSIGKDLLSWGLLDNRPFLRAYHSFGLTLLEREKVAEALEIFTNILSLNPNDNQGVRSLVVTCNFILQRPWEVLAISQQYEDDMMAEIVYGTVLALFQMGLKSDAETALSEAVKYLPLVAQELVKKRHPKPEELYLDRITVGGMDEAYYYWTEHGKFWKNTSGAIDFVKEYLARNAPGLPEESTSPQVGKSPLAKPGNDRKSTKKDKYSVPKNMQSTYAAITGLTNTFNDTHLTEEYADLCRQMTATLCRKRPSPLTKGRPTTWAAAIIYTIARVNFLFDKTQTPHMTATELCKLLGISQNTASSKSTQIMDLLDIMQFQPEWTCPSQMDNNPMAWMIMVDGLIVDVRDAPREIQEEAYRKGLIPYLPKGQ